MATTKLESLSPLPVPTWRWLHINEAALPVALAAVPAYTKYPVQHAPAGCTVSAQCPGESYDGVPHILRETATLVREQASHSLCVEIPANTALTEPLVVEYTLDAADESLVNHLHITAAEGSDATIVLRYTGTGALHAGYVHIRAQQNARLHLVQVQTLGGETLHADAVRAEVAAGADVQLLLAELGAKKAVGGADVTLAGEGARADIDSLYLANAAQEKDLNYRLAFLAPGTEGRIEAKGTLAGAARKVMKSTLDFVRGAAGAKGQEDEAVLVLSDEVVNVSTPLLLCGEDNVEGQHATNIGRPDPDKMYYLMSRGLSGKAARNLLVEASLTPVLDKIQPAALRDEVRGYITEVIYRAP